MFKFSTAFVFVLLSVLTLSSCNNTPNKEVLNNVNNEINSLTWTTKNTVDQTAQDVKTETSTWNVVSEANSWTVDNNKTAWDRVVKVDKKYTTPAWEDKVSFSVKLNWDKIQDVQVEVLSGWDITKKRVESFWKAINEAVVWKTLEEAGSISIVWGSSLTTNAFKEVLKDKSFSK